MISEVCGWQVLLLMVFTFSISFIWNKSWRNVVGSYIIISIPILQSLAFLANPPEVSGIPVLFIAWLIFVVFPTSRDFWVYINWRRITWYDEIKSHKGSFWYKEIPLPILIGMMIIAAYIGFIIFESRYSLVLLWLWATIHFAAVLNRRLKPLALFTINYLPLVSATVYMYQCGSYFSVIYGGSVLVSWLSVVKFQR